MTQPSDDPAVIIRRLRADLRRAHEENERLTELLAGRDQEIRELRARVETRVQQAAAPRENP